MNHNKRSKKIIIYIALTVAVHCLTGCYSTITVTSKERFDNAIASTEQSLNKNGYKKTGASTGKNTDVTQTTTIMYMPHVGYVPYSDTKKEETTINTYSFVDSIGNSVSYSVAFEVKESLDKIWYVENVNVVGCATSTPNHYEPLCGDTSSIKQLNNVRKCDNVYVYDNDKTWTVVIIGLLGVLAAVITLLANM